MDRPTSFFEKASCVWSPRVSVATFAASEDVAASWLFLMDFLLSLRHDALLSDFVGSLIVLLDASSVLLAGVSEKRNSRRGSYACCGSLSVVSFPSKAPLYPTQLCVRAENE